MKKIKSKVLLGIGAITTLATAGSVVLSCGSSNHNPKPPHTNSDQDKLNGITNDMVKAVITAKLNPMSTTPAPDAPTNNKFTEISINGLSDVSISISNWQKDPAQGIASFSIVSIDKGTATVDGAKFGTIKISGYSSTDQQTLDLISKELVDDAITAFIGPDITKDAPDAPAGNKFTGLTISGLSDVSVTISNWVKDPAQGSVSFSISSLDKGIAYVDGAKFGTIEISGFASGDQQLLNGITAALIQAAITAELAPSTTKDVPDAPADNKFIVSINGLSDVSIIVSTWAKDSTQGFVSFSISSINKGLAHIDGTKFGTIQISGYLSTDQTKLDLVTAQMVIDVITTKLAPAITKDVPDAPTSNTFKGITINTLNDVSIIVSTWSKDPAQGAVSFSITSIYKGLAHIDGTKFGTIRISGFLSTDQAKLDLVTTDMVKTAITTKLVPDSRKDAPDAPTGNKFTGILINGLSDVSITVSTWAKDPAQGAVSFSIASINKGLANVDGAKFGTIQISGFLSTDQAKLDGVTTDMVKTVITAVLNPATSKQVPDEPTLNGITINGLSGVTINVSNWTKDTAQGSVSFSISSLDKGLAHVDGTKFGTIIITGFASTDQTKLDGVTTDMVKTVITAVLNPATSKQVPDVPRLTGITINGLSGVDIHVSNWVKDPAQGSVSFSISSLDKGLAHVDGTKFGTIIITGFASTDQTKLDGVTTDMVKTAITAVLNPATSKPVPDAPTLTGITINGLSGVTITVSNWAKDPAQGSVSFLIASLDKGLAHVDGTKFGTIIITGFASTDQTKLDGVTTDMVKTAITAVLNPTTSTPIPNAPAGNKYTGITINGLDGVDIHVLNYQKDSIKGAISFSIVSIDKGTATVAGAKFGTITITGFQPASFKKITIGSSSNVWCTIKTQNSNYFTGTDKGLWKSTDGTTFTNVSGGIQSDWGIETIYQTSNEYIYVGTDDNGLWVSEDYGTTFTKVNGGLSPNWTIRTIYQTSDGNIFVGTESNGLWKSTNGTTFTQVSLGTSSTTWNIQTIYQALDRNIYVGTLGQGLLVSKDDGATFTQVSLGTGSTNWDIQTIYQTSNGNIYVGTSPYGLYQSTDRGTTFAHVTNKLISISSMYQILNGDLLIGTTDGLYVSKDGGTTCNKVGEGLPTTWVYSVFQSPNDAKLFISSDTGLWST